MMPRMLTTMTAALLVLIACGAMCGDLVEPARLRQLWARYGIEVEYAEDAKEHLSELVAALDKNPWLTARPEAEGLIGGIERNTDFDFHPVGDAKYAVTWGPRLFVIMRQSEVHLMELRPQMKVASRSWYETLGPIRLPTGPKTDFMSCLASIRQSAPRVGVPEVLLRQLTEMPTTEISYPENSDAADPFRSYIAALEASIVLLTEYGQEHGYLGAKQRYVICHPIDSDREAPPVPALAIVPAVDSERTGEDRFLQYLSERCGKAHYCRKLDCYVVYCRKRQSTIYKIEL